MYIAAYMLEGVWFHGNANEVFHVQLIEAPRSDLCDNVVYQRETHQPYKNTQQYSQSDCISTVRGFSGEDTHKLCDPHASFTNHNTQNIRTYQTHRLRSP